jgi:phosphoglycerol transferase MdoB-like AlkP superfamily enzyme
MRDRLRLLIYAALFWLVFMIAARGLFLSYNHDYATNLTGGELLKVFLYGLKMDVSLTGYLVMFSSLVLGISALVHKNGWVYYTLYAFTIFALFISCTIVIVDLELYRHWGFRMNTTPFMYISSEAMGSVAVSALLKLILILLGCLAAFLYLYIKTVLPGTKTLQRSGWKTAALMICIAGSMIIPIRGSFTVAPMNTGFVYFHKSKAFANHSAINVVWNFFYSARKSAHVTYPENFFHNEKTNAYVSDLYPSADSTFRIFSTARPNIIIIIIESFTAGIVEPLGGMPEICPNLNQLCHEGILFDNFYATGDRTDKGLIGVLSGYPAQPQTSIIKYPDKTRHLPYLVKEIHDLGYGTSFLYGGDIDFANFRSYLTGCNFDHLTYVDDFPDSLDEGKWGVHDQYVFDQALRESDTTRHPFMQVILTQSSHEPFTVPMEAFVPGKDEESLFLNACHYTDKCLGDFITQARQKAWWKNTVVLVTADHGHRHPGNKELKDKNRFKIPLLLLGGALTMPDTVIHTFAGQTDIANSLLAQLDAPRNEFKFSKNIFGNKVKSFAAYFFEDGYGFVAPGITIVYDNPGKQFLVKDGATEQDLDMSKAYQQVLFSDYNSK